MKDLGKAHFVLGVEIARDRNRKLLGLSPKGYFERILHINMESCNGCQVPVNKRHPLSKKQSPQADLEVQKMAKKLYASLVGSLMYAYITAQSMILPTL